MTALAFQTLLTFCGSIELGNVLDVEPLDKLCPDGSLESISHHHPDAMVPVAKGGRGHQQVATKLTDVHCNLQEIRRC